jgi:cytochrome c oxidase subunit 4
MTAHKQPNYMNIFWALLALTVLEVGVVMIHLPKMVMAILLIAMAVTKAGLVAAYFMHLKFEKRALWAVACAPLILGGILIFLLAPDAHQAHGQFQAGPKGEAAAHGETHEAHGGH